MIRHATYRFWEDLSCLLAAIRLGKGDQVLGNLPPVFCGVHEAK